MSQTPPHPERIPEASVEDPLDTFERLMVRGHQILHVCGWNGETFTAFTPRGLEASRFRTDAIRLVRTCFGEDSRHYQTLKAHQADGAIDVPGILGALEAAHQTYAREAMFNVPAQLLMEMGEDLIELAEVLANAGQRQAAARQSVRVLTARLRRSARELTDLDESIEPDALNDALHARRLYDETCHRRIGACLRIGQDLAGPGADAIPDVELDEAVAWVRSFVTRRR